MNTETIDGNKIIAEFMGHGGGISDEWNNTPANYHSDWLWLMPVVEKIEQVVTFVIDGKSSYWYKSGEIRDGKAKIRETKIEAVYESVLQFIQWYNNNQNK